MVGDAALVTAAPAVDDTDVSPLWRLATGAAAAAVIAGSRLVRIFNRVVRARTQRDQARSMEDVDLRRRADRTAMAPDRWIARLVVRADLVRRPLGAGVGPPG